MASSFQRRIKAEQDTVQFWKRRCQTKDTLVQRLQAIVTEQKTMMSRTGPYRNKFSSRGGSRSSSHRERKESAAEKRRGGAGRHRQTGLLYREEREQEVDDVDEDDAEGSDGAEKREYYRRSARRSSVRRSARRYDGRCGDDGGSRSGMRRERETSHVLLDIPRGVHGNVELNLSWPPATSSIDSEDEDDDEVEGGAEPASLSTIDEGGEEESESKTIGEESQADGDAEKEKEKQREEATPQTESDEGSASSSIELSRSLQSDDSGLLFERYLQ